MTGIPLAVVGLGRMGQAVRELAPDAGFEVVAEIGRPAESAPAVIDRSALRGASVAIEFTTPDAGAANIRALLAAGCSVVSGTTGFDLAPVAKDARASNAALLHAANFSLGMHAFRQAAATAASVLRDAGFDMHLLDVHHVAKRDAPSGTARQLVAALQRVLGREVPVTSIRTGAVPGTHELTFDAPYEQLRVEHVVRDRRVFAAGALRAARWIQGRRGVFTLDDMLAPTGEGQ